MLDKLEKAEFEEPNLEHMREELRRLTRAIERLDEALASPELIAQHTADVGGFMSGVDIVYTAEDVVERAITTLNALKTKG